MARVPYPDGDSPIFYHGGTVLFSVHVLSREESVWRGRGAPRPQTERPPNPDPLRYTEPLPKNGADRRAGGRFAENDRQGMKRKRIGPMIEIIKSFLIAGLRKRERHSTRR